VVATGSDGYKSVWRWGRSIRSFIGTVLVADMIGRQAAGEGGPFQAGGKRGKRPARSVAEPGEG